MFDKFLNGPLMDPEPGQGGGDQKPPEPPAQPDFTKLFADMQKGLIGEFDKRINGVNKETKKHIEALTQGLTSLKTDLENRLKPAEQPQADDQVDDDQVDDPQPPAHQEQPPQQQPRRQARTQQEPQQRQEPPPQAPPAPPRRPVKDPHTIALEKKIADMEKASELQALEMKRTAENADRKERSASLKTALAKHKFSDDTGSQDLFELLVGKLERNEEGEVAGPGGSDLEEFVKAEYDRRPTLHPPKPVSGSGAGQTANGPGGGKKFDLDDLSAQMNPDELDAWSAALASFLPTQKAGGRR